MASLGQLVIVCRSAQMDSIVAAVLLSGEDWLDFQQQCRKHWHEYGNEMRVMPMHRNLEWVQGPMREELRKMALLEDQPPSGKKASQELCLRGAGILDCLVLMMSE